MSNTSTPTLSMKLLIDRKAQRVLFAEARKDVVDFIFSLLRLPVATAVKLVGKTAMVGCIGNLYAGVDKFDSIYLQDGVVKDALLCPTVVSQAANANSSLLPLPNPSVQPKMYRCTNYGQCRNYITDEHGKACPGCGPCGGSMTTEVQYLPSASHGSGSCQLVASQRKAGGFVQGIVTYTVLDDLTVTPVSAIVSSVTLLETFDMRNTGDIEQKTVQLGYNEGLAILKASLKSKSVLTDVFL